MRFAIDKLLSHTTTKILVLLLAVLALSVSAPQGSRVMFALQASAPQASPPQASVSTKPAWPAGLPVYDHVVIVVEENKDFDQIIGNVDAPYINNVLWKQGATFTRMYAEEHHSQGNYFWLFSGSNQSVGFMDDVPRTSFDASNLGEELIRTGHSFKGYSEGLPEIGSKVTRAGLYVRKHIPWISFSNVPNGRTVADSSNLRYPEDFPADYSLLPTVSFVTPNSVNDMHDGPVSTSVPAGDGWLREHITGYYEWAKQHNSLLILTFDENDEYSMFGGLTDPAERDRRKRNRIVTIFAGAHIKPGEYAEGKGVNHVNVLRTLEAMYGLNPSGGQVSKALEGGITDDFLIKDVFDGTH
jgi:phosphatidylinositol-3-phosphatase